MKEEIINKLESLGWMYEAKYWCDGGVMTHIFKKKDVQDPEAYWEVSIEDHHDEDEYTDDWLIYSCFHDPDQKEWDGHQIDISGCVEFETMKLIVEFVGILKKGD